MKKKTRMKLFLAVIGILLLVSISLLSNTIIKCGEPRYEEVPMDYFSNNPGAPLVHVPADVKFNDITYKTLATYLLSSDLETNIGEVNRVEIDRLRYPAFKLKGVDKDRAIALQDPVSGDYHLYYNNEYWIERLPEIIIYSLLILVTSGSMLIIFKGGFGEEGKVYGGHKKLL